MQILQQACSSKKAELRSVERNISRMSEVSQQVEAWLKVHEPKAEGVEGALSHDKAIVPVDVLSRQAIDAQVRHVFLVFCFLLFADIVGGFIAGDLLHCKVQAKYVSRRPAVLCKVSLQRHARFRCSGDAE